MAYCIAMVLIFLKVFFMVTMGILKLVSSAFIDGMWVVALAPVVMTISGSIFHPLEAILAISGLYLLFLAHISSPSLYSFEFNFFLSNNKISQFWSLFVLEPYVHCKPTLM